MTLSRAVELFPTYAEVTSFRVRAAQAGAPESFGCEASTFSSWIAGLWELYGDGRAIAASSQRTVAVELAALQAGKHLSPGMVALVARVLEGASGLAEFEGALAAAKAGANGESELGGSGLSPEESAVLAMAASSREALRAMGAIEPGEACRALPELIGRSEDGACARIADQVTLHARPYASLTQLRFLEALEAAGAIGGFRIDEAPEDVGAVAARFACADGTRAVCASSSDEGASLPTIRFAFPSGRYAEPRLLADVAEEAVARGGRVAFAARDALSLYDEIAEALSRAGLVCAVRARRRFFETDFGRAWASLFRCAHDSDAALADLSDVLTSPFSGMSVAQAQRIDARMRGDRALDVLPCLAEAEAASNAIALLADAASDIEASVVLGAVEDAVWRIPDVTDAYRREQAAAVGVLRETMETVRAACVATGAADSQAALSIVERELARASVNVSRRAFPEGREGAPWDVFVGSMGDVASLGQASCETVVLCGMTSAAYSAAEKGDAAASLLAKLGLPATAATAAADADASRRGARAVVWPVADALSRQRAEVCAAAAVPVGELVVERRLFDENAEPTYPAAVVQELTDCFRPDPSATGDIDNPFSLPACLRAGMRQRGEELLFENAAVAHVPQETAALADVLPFGHVSAANRDRIVLPREIKGGRIVRDPCLSPSQIESYLECPYKWFASRRLRLSELDAAFGPVEMGDFAHRSFERFYRAFWEETGKRKVTADTLDQARGIMRAVLEEPDGHLVPKTELERRDLEALKRRIEAFLDFEVRLLPGFSPAYVEFDIPQDANVSYGGHGVLGRVDRIDVDAQGRAVVIDYKSSVSKDYDLHAAEGEGPRKVQALVYAQAIERMTDLRVVGAIYVSYGRAPRVSGAFDPNAIARDELPAMRHDACQASAEAGETFQGVLDATEERVGSALGRMLAGEVAPEPLTNAVCEWCPVLACPERRG